MESCMPASVKESKHYPRIKQAIRIFQFAFAVANIGLFAKYIVRTSVRMSNSSGAVVGILAAGIAFSIIATAIQCTRVGQKWRVTIALFVMDLLFIAAFIAVSVITALDRNRAAGTGGAGMGMGPGCGNGDGDDEDDDDDDDCRMMGLTSAPLALSILSVISHALSSAMNGGGKPTSRAGKLENPLNNN